MGQTSAWAPSRPFGGTPTRLRSEARQKDRPPCWGPVLLYPGRGAYAQPPPRWSDCSCPVPRAARAQPSCPTIVITSAGSAGPGLAGLAPAYGLRRDFLGRGGGPGAFDWQGRGGIECARLPLFWTFVAVRLEVRLSGKVGRGGTQRHLHPHGTVPLVMNGCSSSGLCAFVDHARKDTSS